MTTTSGKLADAPAHLAKMAGFLRTDPADKVQQNIWFCVKALRDLRLIRGEAAISISALLKSKAHIDAAQLLAPPGWRLVLLKEVGRNWTSTVRNNSGEEYEGFGPTPAAAVASGYIEVYMAGLPREWQ